MSFLSLSIPFVEFSSDGRSTSPASKKPRKKEKKTKQVGPIPDETCKVEARQTNLFKQATTITIGKAIVIWDCAHTDVRLPTHSTKVKWWSWQSQPPLPTTAQRINEGLHGGAGHFCTLRTLCPILRISNVFHQGVGLTPHVSTPTETWSVGKGSPTTTKAQIPRENRSHLLVGFVGSGVYQIIIHSVLLHQ